MKPHIIIALCALASPAWADCGTIIMPPAQYADAKPFAIERTMDFWAIDPFCRQHGGMERGRYEACSFGHVVILPATGPDVTAERQECYRRHELAHVAGWPGNHPGGTYE